MFPRGFRVLTVLFVAIWGCAPTWEYRLREAVDKEFSSQWEFEQSPWHPSAIVEDVRKQLPENPQEVSDKFCQELKNLGTRAVIYLFDELSQATDVTRACQQWVQDQMNFQTRQWLEELGQVKKNLLAEIHLSPLREKNLQTQENNLQKMASRVWVYDTQKSYDGTLLRPKEVLLTFDDGPHPQYSLSIARALTQSGATGVFFHIGRNVSRYPQVLKQLQRWGHGVANHSRTHPCMGCRKGNSYVISLSQALEEIIITHQTIFSVIGQVEPLFRYPYGSSRPDVSSWLGRRRVAILFWNVDSLDWKPNQSPATVLARTVRQLRAQGRGILLFHDIHQRTALMIPDLLEILTLEGYISLKPEPDDPQLRFRHPLLEESIPRG